MALIQESQAARGLPYLALEEAKPLTFAWARALREIPDADLEEVYGRAIVRYDDPRERFSAAHLNAAWAEIKAERDHAARYHRPAPPRCPHCDGLGYQSVLKREGASERIESRGCVCEACPPTQRSLYPLEEPEYHRDRFGRWRHAPSRFGCDAA